LNILRDVCPMHRAVFRTYAMNRYGKVYAAILFCLRHISVIMNSQRLSTFSPHHQGLST